MKVDEQIKLFCELFECDKDYARQCFQDMAEFIEAALSMGESVKFPALLELSIDEVPARNIYNFRTGIVEPTKPKYKAVARFGKKINVLVNSASLIHNKRKRQGKKIHKPKPNEVNEET